MPGKNEPFFYAPSPDSRLRSALSRALDRGIPWREIEAAGLARADDDNVDSVVAQLDQLKPLPAHFYVELEPESGPSLDQKRETWRQLNQSFED